MKKFLAVMMMFLFVGSAFAIELKANGSYRIRMFNTFNGGGFDYGQPWAFDDDADDDTFFDQRFRLNLTADNGDGVRGVVQFEMGDSMWGDDSEYTRLGSDGKDVEIRHAYLELDKEVYVKAGVFTLITPNSIILDDELAGIIVGKDFGNFAVNLIYSRLYDGGYVDSKDDDKDNDFNLYGVMVPIKADTFNVTPYFLYADIEDNSKVVGEDGNVSLVNSLADAKSGPSGSAFTGRFSGFNFNTCADLLRCSESTGSVLQFGEGEAYWVGVAMDGKALGDISYKLNAVYGYAEVEDLVSAGVKDDVELEGYLLDALVSYNYEGYKFDLYGLYSSGYDKGDLKDRELGVLPTVSPDYQQGAPFFFDGIGLGDYALDPAGYSMVGAAVTFNSIDQLSHTFDVAYIKSMVDDDILDVMDFERAYYDEFYQVAFVSDYKISEGTTFSMMLGYLQPDASSKAKDVEDDAAYAVNFQLQYDF